MVMSWLTMVGTASLARAFETGMDSNSSRFSISGLSRFVPHGVHVRERKTQQSVKIRRFRLSHASEQYVF